MISIFVAAAKNNVIGKKGDLPWRLKSDLARFKELTSGHPVIMGRNTYLSLPEKFRPLPNRTNIIISRTSSESYEGTVMVKNLAEALHTAKAAPGSEELFIIGGGQIYALALPVANRIYLTRVDAEVDGDVFFPELDDVRWKAKKVGTFKQDDDNQFAGTFWIYNRTGKFPIVEPANSRTEKFKEYLHQILAEGTCPFCPGGATHRDQEIIHKNKDWWLVFTLQPLPNTFPHFMIVPYRHITNMKDVTSSEFLNLQKMMKWAEKTFKNTGVAYYWRQGDPLVTGASVSHLHIQAISPTEFTQVGFGRFIKQPE